MPVHDRTAIHWNDFNYVKLDNKRIDNLILCKLCKRIFIFNKDSTSAQTVHNKACKKKTNNPEIVQSINKKFLNRKLDQKTQKRIDRLTALASATDNRPHSFARGDGFLNLVQFYVDDSAANGKFDVSKYSPHASTVVDNLKELKDEIKDLLIKKLKTIFGGCCILDHWSSKLNKIKFIGISLR